MNDIMKIKGDGMPEISRFYGIVILAILLAEALANHIEIEIRFRYDLLFRKRNYNASV